LNTVVAEVERRLRPLLPSSIDWLVVLEPGLGLLPGNEDHLSALLVNLILNARDAMPQGGQLWVATAHLSARQIPWSVAGDRGGPNGVSVNQPSASRRHHSRRWIVLTVSDTGRGLDEETVARWHRTSERISPFPEFSTSTREEEKDHPSRLTIIEQVVRTHGGIMRVTSKLGSGTTFTICFPEADPEPTGRTTSVQLSPVRLSPGQETLLLVEDHDAVRTLSATVLRRCGYIVLEVRNGVEALDVSEQHNGVIHLLLADLHLPEMDGVELAKELLRLRPNLKVLFTSGAQPQSESLEVSGGHEPGFLPKPFRPEDLLRAVRRLLDS
jgi:CheY-like chemotaxis protein